MKNKIEKYAIQQEFISDGFFDFNNPDLCQISTDITSNYRVFRDIEKGVYFYKSDSIELMDKMLLRYPDGCFDMIFVDPPYFLSNGGITCQAGKMVSVNKGSWDKSRGVTSNHEFNHEWLQRCQRLLKPNGTIWVSGTMHIIFSIGYAMQQLGFKFLNDIAWEKPNPPPNLACRYFTHSTETLIWAAKNKNSRHCFNYEDMKIENDGKQMKSVWKIAPPAQSEKIFGKHPTQKPLALMQRCIRSSTIEGNFVFDPFAGSGSTGVAAISLSRKFCGIEIEEDFVQLSSKRLSNALLLST